MIEIYNVIMIKTYLKSSSIIFFFIFCSLQMDAQVHDFDSLYQNSKAFKKYAKSMLDTMDFFNNDKVLTITIESDFKNLVKQKYKDENQPAVFKFHLNDTITVTRNIQIKPRGNMRKGSCFFPPLKLNFLKDEMVMKQLKEFDKMKMVMDCKRGDIYE